MRPSILDLERAYLYLIGHKPFSSWGLPPISNVKFVVNASKQLQGEWEGDPHTIKVSSYFCKTHLSVLETVAHEMVHLHCEQMEHFNHADHCQHFRRYAKQVCNAFGFDINTF